MKAVQAHVMYNLPPPFPPLRRNWWQRNWPWFVPTGCLALLLAFALLVGGGVLMVFKVMKSSEVYRTAVHRAETNGLVTRALGAPITEGWRVSGNINMYNDAGRANLTIPIAGSKMKGTIYVVATKSEGVWDYSKLDVRVDRTGQTFDLHDVPR